MSVARKKVQINTCLRSNPNVMGNTACYQIVYTLS